MKVDTNVSVARAAHAANGGSLVVIEPSGGVPTFAIKCYMAGQNLHGFALLGSKPRLLLHSALGSSRVLEIADAVLSPTLDPKLLKFNNTQSIAGSLAITNGAVFLMLPPPQQGYPAIFVDVDSGDIPTQPPISDAVWCMTWRVGFWRSDKFEVLTQFP